MRELTVRIRFLKYSLGNVKTAGRYRMPRSPNGAITFLSTWHRSNMRFAAKVLGRHHDEVENILWDIDVEGAIGGWHRRYYQIDGGKSVRFASHEAFQPGQVIGINCVVPSAITDDDFWRLMALAGKYRGLSPWKHGEFGLFEVESVRERRARIPTQDSKENGKSLS